MQQLSLIHSDPKIFNNVRVPAETTKAKNLADGMEKMKK